MNDKYILKSAKAVEFYNKNPSLDFNHVNELFVDLIQNITNTIKESISVNEIKLLLNSIHKKVENVEEATNNGNRMLQMTYDHIGEQKTFYVQQMKDIIENRKQDSNILTLIRETNNAFLDKSVYSILQQFPKLTNEMKTIQQDVLKQSQDMFMKISNQTNISQDPKLLENMIQSQYQTMTNKMMCSIQSVFNQDSVFYQNNMELKHFLEKQKNSTKKGKESENKLGVTLNETFPNASIKDKSNESKACDYLLQRQDKSDILFENKDYQTNVPNEELRKFIRDIEYQNKHGIMLSQHSGIQNKHDFQIDIHMNQIMVFVHNVHYDKTKIRIAVNIIDHLDAVLQSQQNSKDSTYISTEQLSEINKEYLCFIGQKKQLIEMCKKNHKDQLKQIEDFEMPNLTSLLNRIFTNVDHLSFKCNICNKFNAKNKRALVTHQNKCKKIMMNLNDMSNNEV